MSVESFPDVMRISIHSKRVLLRLSEGTPARETGWAGVDTGTQRPRLVAISEWSRERSHGQIWVRVSPGLTLTVLSLSSPRSPSESISPESGVRR